MFTLPELDAAAALVHAAFPPTPQIAWPLLAERTGAETWVKQENHTPTGAFKVRGGLVHLDRLRRSLPELKGVVSATRGNHGQSLAYAGRRHGVRATIVVPHGNSREKNAAMRAFGAELIEHGTDFEAAREEAVRLADARRLRFVSSSIRTSCSAWRRTALNCCARSLTCTRSTCRSASAPASAERSWRATCWA